MHLTTDPETCVGSGQCALALPEVFDQDDDTGIVVVLDAHPAREFHRDVHEAVRLCPVRALTVVDT